MTLRHKLAAGLAMLAFSALVAMAQTIVGVSWVQLPGRALEDRRGGDQGPTAKLGGTYVSADAGGSPEKQLADIDGLIASGAKALIILAQRWTRTRSSRPGDQGKGERTSRSSPTTG